MEAFIFLDKGSTNLGDRALDIGRSSVGGDSTTGKRSEGLSPQGRSLTDCSTEEHFV